MHKIVTDEIQRKQYVSLQMILRRNLVWAKYKGIYRIQALDANSFHFTASCAKSEAPIAVRSHCWATSRSKESDPDLTQSAVKH
jgi:hypothetical protein